MGMYRSVRLLLSVLAVTASLGVSAPRAQEARAVGVTPPRLSFIDGDVSYFRPGAEDWVAAQVNTALGAGDSVYAGDGGNLEVEIGTRAYVRAGSGTQLGIESLETGYLQLRVPAGHAVVDLRRLPEGQEIDVDTPNGAFLISHTGYFRFDVDDESTHFAARRGGVARVVPAGSNDETEVGAAQDVVVRGTDTAQLERTAPAADDAWDRWNNDRIAGLTEQPRSAQYVSPDVAGVDDLDRYGDWRDTPNYGHVWVPHSLPSDWAPYSTGRWVWDGYYGWTWVDDSPWGWAPYHYGRWCHVDDYWAWAPGPVVAQPVYSPALVAFFGGEGGGVSVAVGAPFVSWVALGWGEPVVPWWGPHGFVGRPYWGGWGGPRVVNNTVINNTTIVNVNNINHYDNFRQRNAVIGVEGDRFGRGRFTPVRIDPARVHDLRPVHGELGVHPVRESLVAARDHGRVERPPDRIQNRSVVATRPPQDPSRQPRAAGLIGAGGAAARRPEARIVTPRGGPQGGGVERTHGRDIPPPRGAEERARGGMERSPSDVRGGAPNEHGERGRMDRAPGAEHGAETRGAPQPPSGNLRGPQGNERERQGHGREERDLGTTQHGNERAPTPPPMDHGRGSEHVRGRDEAPTPPRGSTSHGADRINQPNGASRIERQGGADQERGRHGERTDRTPRNDTIQQPHMEQRQPEPRANQHERAPRNESPREIAPPSDRGNRSHGADRQPERHFEQPQRQPAPERMPAPPSSGGGHGRDSTGGHESSQRGPAMERQAPPRQEHGGGGGEHGAGNPHADQPQKDRGNHGKHEDDHH